MIRLDHLKQTNMSPKISPAWMWLLSPTYKFAEWRKNRLLQEPDGRRAMTKAIEDYNLYYLRITIVLALAAWAFVRTDFGFDQSSYINWSVWIFFGWMIFFSRGIEIFKAFLDDAVDKLNHRPSQSHLRFGDRLKLAFRSYIELMVGFGTLYYILPQSMMKEGFTNIFQAIYFSGVTMTTIGYGDNSPVHMLTQFLVVLQVFCGLTLALVSFTVYTSLALAQAQTPEESNVEPR